MNIDLPLTLTPEQAARFRARHGISFEVRKSAWEKPLKADFFRYNGAAYKIAKEPVETTEGWKIYAVEDPLSEGWE